MADPRGNFIWYELMTTDADAAERFYSDVVGWQIADAGLPNMDYRILSAADGPVGGLMPLSSDMQRGGARPAWLGYVAVDDVDASIGSVTDAGGTVIVAPTDIPAGRFSMVADPQGIPFYVMQTPSDEAPSEAFKAMAEGHCAWNELATPDLEAGLAFYTGQFGWTLGQTMPMGDAGDYQMINRGDEMIGGAMSAAQAPPMWRFYFRVPSIEEALARIEEGGATVIHGPQEVPGDDEIVIGMDPQDTMFALVAKRA